MKWWREYCNWMRDYGRAISEQRDREYREYLMWKGMMR